MPDKVNYEHGARQPVPLHGADPSDDFSQKAAENKKPPLGMGLAGKVDTADDDHPQAPPGDTAEAPVVNPNTKISPKGAGQPRP